MRLPYVSVLLVVLVGTAIAQSPQYEQWRYWDNGVGVQKAWLFGDLPEAVATDVKNRWDEIGNSLKSSASGFAGTYYQIGNRGYYLRWSPEKGFVYIRYYELYVEDVSYGDANVTESGVHFNVKREMQRPVGAGKPTTPADWFPALNGKYLIRRNDLPDFVDFYGGFGDFNGFPRRWNCDCDPFAERISSERVENDQKTFIVPDRLLPFIKTPIVGRIIRVGRHYYGKNPVPYNIDDVEYKASLTSVTIDLGRSDGVVPRLIFLVSPDIDTTQEMLFVTSVGYKSSAGVIVRTTDRAGREAFIDSYDDSGKPAYKSYQPIRKGTIIRTRDIKSL